ncbi:MAG: hypothetical protein JSV79_03040 [Armatimonadota bacterium]|nr:MAG: hypothetical protein JSV79_03040 [Armatimonadota bacterium]
MAGCTLSLPRSSCRAKDGRLRLYRTIVPFAIGLIVGDMLNAGIWTVVALATGGGA